MSKKIVLSLSPHDMERAIREIQAFERYIQDNTAELLRRLAQRGYEIASFNFSWATYDGTNDVSVSVEPRSDTSIAVVAVGNATLFIEFGTGITYPDDHPEAATHQMIRGEYGHQLGRLPGGWRYDGDPGTNGEVITSGKHAGQVHTYGNPANMCMYRSVREVEREFEEIVRSVFV